MTVSYGFILIPTPPSDFMAKIILAVYKGEVTFWPKYTQTPHVSKSKSVLIHTPSVSKHVTI